MAAGFFFPLRFSMVIALHLHFYHFFYSLPTRFYLRDSFQRHFHLEMVAILYFTYMTSSGELLGGGVIYRRKAGRASPLHVIYVHIGLADDAGGNDADERPRYIYMYGWVGVEDNSPHVC